MAELIGNVVAVGLPAFEPVGEPELSDHLRLYDGAGAAPFELQRLIREARDYVERRLGRTLCTATLRLSLDGFPGWEIQLPRGPVQSVTSVAYYDTDGTLTTMDSGDYRLDADAGLLQPDPAGLWPISQSWRSGAVRVTYVAGHATADAVPPAAKRAIKLLAGHWFANREAAVTGTISSLMELAVDAILEAVTEGGY